VNGKPADGCDDHNFHKKLFIDCWGVEVVAEEQDWWHVDDQSKQDWDDDFRLQFVHLGEDVQQLNEDEGGEGDTHNVHKRIVEENNTWEHYDCTLVDWDPNPDQEGLEVKWPSFL
jgi:hypothetical protein